MQTTRMPRHPPALPLLRREPHTTWFPVRLQTEQAAAELLAGGFAPPVSADPSALMAAPAPSSRSRGRSTAQDAALHPAILLGHTSLCSVVCNGFQGEFLGGHDRDMYIRATGPEYAHLPLVDVSAGGCIMSASQFERAAGRELSKKWKGEGCLMG